MMKCLRMLAMAAPLSIVSVPANAAIYVFDVTNGYTANFRIDDALLSPPAYSDADSFIVDNVSGVFAGGSTIADSITFNRASFGGGLIFQFGADFVDFAGDALFSGTTAAPTLLTGSFSLNDQSDPTRTATLTISAVPEPLTWSMMILGFALTGAAIRQRRVSFGTTANA